MANKKEKYSLAAYAYEKDWFFMTDIIDVFKGTGYSAKEWGKRQEITMEEKKLKKFWR